MRTGSKPFLFGAVVGSGLVAKAADNAGADYLLALNAGRLRIHGASALSCFLPVRSTNEWVMEFSEAELLPRCKAPLFAGLSVSDPMLDIASLVHKVKAMGFAGVCNFPTATSIDGSLGRLFEREGLGFTRELELARHSRDAGLDVIAYVKTNKQAHQIMDAGANIICVNLGFTSGGTGVNTPLTLEAAAERTDRVLDDISSSIAKLCHGGPIGTAEQALKLMGMCGVEGFIAGSALDRLPVEQALDEVTQNFTAIPKLRRTKSAVQVANDALAGSSAAMTSIRKDLEQLCTNDTPVLIAGETGTGKSKIAYQLHDMSPIAAKTPVTVDCPAIDSTYGGIQLLGQSVDQHGRDIPGALELSTGNTVILEDVNSLDKTHQGKLLSFMDYGTVTRIGEHHARDVNARVISTTTMIPEQLSQNEDFRIDLYYRLAGHVIVIPPLRERVDDIQDLAMHFARTLSGDKSLIFSNAAMDVLVEHDWRGNVRELKHVVVRALQSTSGGMVTRRAVEYLRTPRSAQSASAFSTHDESSSEKGRLLQALKSNAYNRTRTAEELGITTRTLYTKIKKFGIEV